MTEYASLTTVTVLCTSVLAVLLICGCLMSRYNRGLAIWAVAYLLCSVGSGLIIARGLIGDFWSVYVAGTLLAAAFGLMWKGARRFENQATPLHLVFVGAAIWFLAALMPPVRASTFAQAGFVSSIIIGYVTLTGMELWRHRKKHSAPQWLANVLLVVFACASVFRVFLPGRLLFGSIEHGSELSAGTAISFEVLLQVFGTGIILACMATHCANANQHWSSMIDLSTGTLNRRGFTECGMRALRLMSINRQCATLVEFDLTWFRAINGSRGYPVGNDVLCMFCEVVSRSMRPCDLFGRVGDRQFACLLANISHAEALLIGEGIKNQISTLEAEKKQSRLHLAVNTGYAVANGGLSNLPILLLEAEESLHRSHAQRMAV